ncbi:bifunctional alpha/beta hydrolase/OsmC family protein [Pyruvatibacter sp.]|uniref:bifunctional alpha/beta hydrolase/OsmC family protein n=1 Tax=Pyruvatibacter sp. TaxID=1981328 RepID=UPI003265F9E0
MAKQIQRIEFTGSLGEKLAGRLEMPKGQPRAYALFAHCFTCSKDIFAATRIASRLCDHGIAVLRFDFTGLGHSDGDFANTDFSSNVADLVHAANYLRDTHEAPSILIGHSLGGAAVLAAAGDVPEAKAVATIGAPADAAHVAENFGTKIGDIEADGEAEVELAGRPFRIRKAFLDDIRSQEISPRIASLKKALIVFHGPRDATVGIENAEKIFLTAKHPKSFVSLDDADHLLSRRADATYVADVLSSWATRYLGEEAVEEKALVKPDPERVTVVETRKGKFQSQVLAGEHVQLADEPESYGGLDTGPTPYQYLNAALGACTAMTMRLYADRKSIPMERVVVRVGHDRIHVDDCEECAATDGNTQGQVDVMNREIEVTGALDDEQRRKLMEIADKCPVHRTLENKLVVRTTQTKT